MKKIGLILILVIGCIFLLALPIGVLQGQQPIAQSTNPWITQNNPTTASAVALTSSVKATLTTSVNVKASVGNVYGFAANNGSASTICWVQFINSSGAGTLGTGVIFAIPMAISGTVNYSPGNFALSNFSSGIAVGIATTATGSSACGTAGNVTVFYH